MGDNISQIDEVLGVCYKYFDVVKFNTPSHGDFSKATKWVWEQVSSDYFLHLEDDWLLNKVISKNYLVSTLIADENVASIRLNRQTSIKDKVLNRVSLNPILFKTAFIKEALIFYDEKIDPEKQFSINPLKTHTDKYIHLAYGDKKGNYIEGAFVTDIGKYWRKSNGFKKVFEGQKFTWQSEPSNLLISIKSWVFFKTIGLRKIINKYR